MHRWYYFSERLDLPLWTVNSLMKTFHGKNENGGENSWFGLDVDWGSQRGAACLKSCVAQSLNQRSHAAFNESSQSSRSCDWMLVLPLLSSWIFFLISEVLLEYILHFHPCSSTVAWLCCELRNICYALPAGLHFFSPRIHTGLTFDCEWRFFLLSRYLFRILQKECWCRNSSVAQIRIRLWDKWRLLWKKMEVVLWYVRDHHWSSLTPLTKRNSYLNPFGFAENLWEMELGK